VQARLRADGSLYTDHTHLENLRYPDFDPRKLRGPAWLALERKLDASTTRLLTRSRNVAASMIEDYGADPDRTLVVGSGSNVDFGSAWFERADRPSSQEVRILFVGKDWVRKGGPDLLEAFGRVHAAHPETRLVVVGPTDLLPAPGLEALGHRTLEELREIYRDADVFCLPTRLEPFGVVILEAMHAGLRVIATRIGAMPDLVEEGRSVHLVPPGDPDALEQALLRLVEDAELRRRMGERGRERALTDFSWDGVADRVARLILAEVDSHAGVGGPPP